MSSFAPFTVHMLATLNGRISSFREVRQETVLMTRNLRADARENRDHLMAAARELFAERGLSVPMRDIARRAGVGPATLYRHFPTKQHLVDDAFLGEMHQCQHIVEQAHDDDDAWRGFSAAVAQLMRLNTGNRGFVDAVLASPGSSAAVSEHRRTLLTLLQRLVARARSGGSLRPDVDVDDLVLVLLAARGLASVPPSRRSATTERFAELVLDAFRSAPRGRAKGTTATAGTR